jgi:LytS/YehU family sensor histidine kinase
MVLNNSEEKVLPLQQELEMLKLYIELEQLRFNNNFEFELSVADDINLYEIQIPAMLIQPYIENAIWHGLMNLNKERKGILRLTISMNEDVLKIVIEDNGIGRQRSKEYKNESVHRPVAMKLTEQRLMIINQMKNYENAKVIINDVFERTEASGTKVEIFIPV